MIHVKIVYSRNNVVFLFVTNMKFSMSKLTDFFYFRHLMMCFTILASKTSSETQFFSFLLTCYIFIIFRTYIYYVRKILQSWKNSILRFYTHLYVFRSPESMYAIFTAMYVCMYVCVYQLRTVIVNLGYYFITSF